MNPEDQAAQALAEIESKAASHIASVRANAAAAKQRLEEGVLNVRSQADAAVDAEAPSQLSDDGWEFDLASENGEAFKTAEPEQELQVDEDWNPSTFAQELGIATDADGIPLPE